MARLRILASLKAVAGPVTNRLFETRHLSAFRHALWDTRDPRSLPFFAIARTCRLPRSLTLPFLQFFIEGTPNRGDWSKSPIAKTELYFGERDPKFIKCFFVGDACQRRFLIRVVSVKNEAKPEASSPDSAEAGHSSLDGPMNR